LLVYRTGIYFVEIVEIAVQIKGSTEGIPVGCIGDA
jgi:hypothetical protein